MMEIDGEDLLNTFNSKMGMIGLKYLIQSYYHPSSFVKGSPDETAYNEGQRSVVIGLIDKMRTADPKLTANLLSEIEYLGLNTKQKRYGQEDETIIPDVD